MTNLVFTVPAAWLRRLTRPAYGGTWSECEAYLRENGREWQRVEELISEMQTTGIHRPVILVNPSRGSVLPRVGDGVRRCVAAMQLGMTVPVRIGYQNYSPDDKLLYDTYNVSTPTRLSDDEFDRLHDAVFSLSSFRCDPEVWVQTDCMTSHADSGVHFHYPRHEHLRTTICEELCGRLREHGFNTVVSFVEEVGDE